MKIKEEKYNIAIIRLKNIKNNIMNNENVPKTILKYLEIVKDLDFKERPDYDLLINIFTPFLI